MADGQGMGASPAVGCVAVPATVVMVAGCGIPGLSWPGSDRTVVKG